MDWTPCFHAFLMTNITYHKRKRETSRGDKNTLRGDRGVNLCYKNFM